MKLYDFQQDILKQSASRNRVAYYLDMGLGKTFVGSEKLNQLDAMKNLVICQKSKIDDWIKHFKLNYPNHQVFDLTKEDPSVIIRATRCVAIINYDLVFRRPLAKAFNGFNFTLLLDESSLIQNHTAKRTKVIINDLKPANVILLSGTPVGGKYENLWSQLKLLGYPFKYPYFFEEYVKYYKLEDGRPFPIKIPYGYKNEEELKKIMKNLGCYFLKTSEVLELPRQNFISVNLPAPPFFREFKKDGIVEFRIPWINGQDEDVEIVGDNMLNKLLGFRKLCGIYNQAKWKAFGDLIDSSQSRFIVFYNYNLELAIIRHILEEKNRPLSIVNGNEKDLSAYEKEDNSVTAIQYQAGAMGLNLQKGNKIIYWSPTYSSDLFEQSKKRIHRIGQSEPCFYYLLKSGFDYSIYRALERKENYTNALFEKDLLNDFLFCDLEQEQEQTKTSDDILREVFGDDILG